MASPELPAPDPSLPETRHPRVVIVGGGFGGIALAAALRGGAFQVVMLDRRNYHTFQPLLYQVATAGLEPDSIAFPLRKIFARDPGFVFRMAEALEVVPARKVLKTSIGNIPYDHLVIATGSETNTFGLEEIERHCFRLKSVTDALDLRSYLLQNFEQALLTADVGEREALMSFVVVGGGPTGVEIAGALAELRRHVLPKDYPELDLRRMRIHLVESSDRLLKAMSEGASREARRTLEHLGVELWLGTGVVGTDGRVVRTREGKRLQARSVIWTAGVKGAPVPGLDPERQLSRGRILVDEFNRVLGADGIYALGDVAEMRTAEFPNGHPMMAPPAMQQGRSLARNLVRLVKGQPLKPFVYRDKGSMATIGRNHAVADLGRLRFRGFPAWMLWLGVHLLQLMGFRNRLLVFVNWVWNYLSYDRGNRLIIRTALHPGSIEKRP